MKKLLLIAGPCAIENREVPFVVAEKVKTLCSQLGIDYVFKSSLVKANRTSLDSFSGIGFSESLEILQAVKNEFNVPVLTDVHESHEVSAVAEVADYLQIPAFLCRQTALLLAAGKSNCVVNIKKGQFVAPQSMQHAVEKVRSTGNNNILLTERGTSFGYGDLVVDFTSIPIMQRFNVPVILDATHCLQKPNQASGVTGGDPSMIATMCYAGMSVGADGLFIETHPNPSCAKSDAASMLQLDQLETILKRCLLIREAVNKD